MKPQSIKMFDYLFLGTLIIGTIGFFLNLGDAKAQLEADPNAAQLGIGTGILIAIFVFSMAINLLLWHFISNVRSKIAMWIMVVFYAVGLAMTLPSLGQLGTLAMVIALLNLALQGAAIWHLFRPDAKAYMDRKDIDPDTFR